jgi:hypothetical protein
MFLKFKQKSRISRFTYNLVTGLAIVVFWRGAWGLLDLYLFPANEVMSYTSSVILGVALLYLNDFSLSELT